MSGRGKDLDWGCRPAETVCRMGELLKQFDGSTPRKEGALLTSQAAVADAAGISEHQRKRVDLSDTAKIAPNRCALPLGRRHRDARTMSLSA